MKRAPIVEQHKFGTRYLDRSSRRWSQRRNRDPKRTWRGNAVSVSVFGEIAQLIIVNTSMRFSMSAKTLLNVSLAIAASGKRRSGRDTCTTQRRSGATSRI